MSENTKQKTHKKSKKWVWILLALFMIPVAAAIYVGCAAISDWQGEATRIYIPANASHATVADTLNAHLNGYGARVARLLKWQGGNPAVVHGSYVVEPGTTALQMSRRLLHGRQTPVKLTYNNVRTLPQLAERVAGYMEWSADDFLSACDSVLPEMGYSPQQYISAFLPDTYEFYWTASPEKVIERLTKERNRFWSEERRAKAERLDLTPVEVSTVASIVEEETNKSDEYGKVAGLYLNRLKKGMMLQADPTVKFAVGDFSLRRIGKAQLDVVSPYNTYRNVGLPPGPIRLASQRAIDAVLNAPEHPYLYMCAKEDFSGYHNFAVDLKTHQANARRYQAELNRRGIR